MDQALAIELARMAARDQRIRRRPKRDSHGFVRRLDAKTAEEWQRVDTENAERLARILSRDGWPGRSLVGEQGAHDAWLIAQHTDHHPAVQRRALELLSDAVGRDEASPRDLAYLTDRVRVNEGRKQVFGTQIGDFIDGVAIPKPVEDPLHVDERRAEVGLESLDDYVRDFSRRLRGD